MHINTRMFSSLNARSLVFGIVIVAAVLAFVFTGFGSLKFSNLSSLDPNTAAKVGGEKIDMQQFASAMMTQSSTNFNTEQKNALAHRVLSQLVMQQILVQQSNAIGWVPSEDEIAAFIRAVPAFQNNDTKQFDIKLFKNYVADQQISELSFYAYLQQQLALQKIQNLLILPAVPSTKILDVQNQINNTEFHLQYMLIVKEEPKLTNDSSAKKLGDNKLLNTLSAIKPTADKFTWVDLKKPYKVTDGAIPELGMANELAQIIFSLKKPGDTTPKALKFGSKQAMIKLVSISLPPKQTAKQQEELKKEYVEASLQDFGMAVEKSLEKTYEQKGNIKINPALFN